MPQIDGISFCKKLNKVNSNIYKILLTGAEKDEVITEALENGHIDCYLSKSDKNIFDKLRNTIKNGVKEYFNKVYKELRVIMT